MSNATSFSQTLSWTVGKSTGIREIFVNTAQSDQAKNDSVTKSDS